MSELLIGLISGTSIDAVDTALLECRGKKLKIKSTHKHFIPESLRKKIQALCEPGDNEINRLGEADVLVGRLFSQAVNTLLEKNNLRAKQIKAIGSHGQTIRHQPKGKTPFTIQIGDPNIIAAETGITTIADFRRKDMALGGQGAPLAPIFHQQVLHDKKQDRIILNIGGIANITVLKASDQNDIMGFDTGPGNTLLDAWTKKHLNQPFDNEGTWAASGKINQTLLTQLLSDEYFCITPPKSTGRELFNLTWLEKQLDSSLSPEDIQATLTELTAQSIIQAIEKTLPNSSSEILVCGGGAHNKYLMERLQKNAPQHAILETDQKGLPADWIEAALFAWLAKQTLEKNHLNLKPITGSQQPIILGAVYYA